MTLIHATGGGGGGTRYIPGWGGAARPLHTLTLFKTNIADFPTLRHLTQFKTKFDKSIP